MLGLKLNHVSKRGQWFPCRCHIYFNHPKYCCLRNCQGNKHLRNADMLQLSVGRNITFSEDSFNIDGFDKCKLLPVTMCNRWPQCGIPDSKVHGGQHGVYQGPTGPRWDPCGATWILVSGNVIGCVRDMPILIIVFGRGSEVICITMLQFHHCDVANCHHQDSVFHQTSLCHTPFIIN